MNMIGCGAPTRTYGVETNSLGFATILILRALSLLLSGRRSIIILHCLVIGIISSLTLTTFTGAGFSFGFLIALSSFSFSLAGSGLPISL